jgi:hypothetical protein
MKYPIFNLGIGPCDEFFFPELFLYSPIFFDKKDLEVYLQYYHEKEYVDVSGEVYIAIGAKETSSWLRKMLNLKRKFHIEFEKVGKCLTFEEVKNIYIECLSGFKSNEAKAKHLELVDQSNTIEDLL